MMPGAGVLHKGIVMAVLNAALQSADPYLAVLNALRAHLPAKINTQQGKIYVMGAGKAGAAMSRAAEDVVGDAIAQGLVIVKDGYTGTGDGLLSKIELAEAGHPVPDMRGVEATERALRIAKRAQEGDIVVCLVSGGGSALLVAPAEGVTLEDLQRTTRALLLSGATINELNAVRKHLSRVSGGLLARAVAPARALSLILSDVTGSPLDVIASGPTAPDPTTYSEALDIIYRYGLANALPPAVLRRLSLGAEGNLPETPKADDALFDMVSNILVASNVIAVEAAASQACGMGLDTAIVTTYLEGEAREAARVVAGVAKEIAAYGRPVKRPGCVLFGGETTVTVRGNGIGGRNTELALSAAIAIDGLGQDVVIAALATDGGDGTSPSAGAIADGTTIDRAKALGLDAYESLANNDSYTFWQVLGDAILTGPTGTNVNDIIGVFVF